MTEPDDRAGLERDLGTMPKDPEEPSGPVARPSVTTAAGVLAFAQAAATALASAVVVTALITIASFGSVEIARQAGIYIGGTIAEGWVAVVVQLAGVVVLIVAGRRVLAGTGERLYLAAMGLQIVLCVYWLIRGAFALVPLALLIMPLLGVILLLGAASQQYIRSRSA
jgi:hypothetical protein